MQYDCKLFQKIIDERSIYACICGLDNYIEEKNLLNEDDYKLLYEIIDEFNFEKINNLVKDCQIRLKDILSNNGCFDAKVYFKYKSKDNNSNLIKFRPIYTATLIDQICIMSIASNLIFNNDLDANERSLSSLSKCLPNNFFGNIPSLDIYNFFYKWQDKYAEYTECVNEAINNYKENKKYKYKVSLDLKNFFPSIDLKTLKMSILDTLDYNEYNGEIGTKEIDFLLDKLFYFKIDNIEVEEFKDNNINMEDFLELKGNIIKNKGLPQGLPHTYYFANIRMLKISEVIIQHFGSCDSYFYVDDSVIFININDINIANETETDWLIKKISQINNDLNKLNLGVTIHANTKSDITKINTIKSYEMYAKSLTNLTSICSNEMFLLNHEKEEKILASKMEAILKLIETDLEYSKEKEKNNNEYSESYLKRLRSYRKYYSLRLQILQTRLGKMKIDSVKNIFNNIYGNDDIMHNVIEEKSFYGSINYFTKLLNENERSELLEIIGNKYLDIINYCTVPVKANYFINFKKIIKLELDSKLPCIVNIVNSSYRTPYNLSVEKIMYEVKNIFLMYENNELVELISKKNNFSSLISFTYYNSFKYRNTLLNAFVSLVLGYSFSNSIITNKSNRRKIKQYEIILLAYLRNPYVNEKSIQSLSMEIQSGNFFNDENMRDIDYKILEVINDFMLYVKKPENIRNLIIAHNYTSMKWQNGSKFLYFYTLHNQEHAIRLIKESICIVKSINLLQLCKDEWFILFMSCYLHDIAMTVYPDLNIMAIDKLDLDLFAYSLWSKIGPAKSYEDIKPLLIDVFKEIDASIEYYIRNNHERKSAEIIEKDKNLRLIDINDTIIKEQIGRVCESHGHEAAIVYNEKARESSKINLKFIKILLRIADLLDMDKTRVNPIFLEDNYKIMPDVSRFHWHSHSIIEDCSIESQYDYNKKEGLNEKIIINIKLNYWAGIKRECKLSSQKKGFYSIINDDMKDTFSICFDHKEKSICQMSSNVMCKWMCEKNKWLYNELISLSKYLKRTKSPFNSSLIINYTTLNKNKINYLNFINNYLNR